MPPAATPLDRSAPQLLSVTLPLLFHPFGSFFHTSFHFNSFHPTGLAHPFKMDVTLNSVSGDQQVVTLNPTTTINDLYAQAGDAYGYAPGSFALHGSTARIDPSSLLVGDELALQAGSVLEVSVLDAPAARQELWEMGYPVLGEEEGGVGEAPTEGELLGAYGRLLVAWTADEKRGVREVGLLLAAGASVNYEMQLETQHIDGQDLWEDRTALHMAALYVDLAKAELLLSAGARLGVDLWGDTPIDLIRGSTEAEMRMKKLLKDVPLMYED